MATTPPSKRIRALADQLRERCADLGTALMPDDALQVIAGVISQTATNLGVTERTVVDRYMTEQHLDAIARATAKANATTLDAIRGADTLTIPRFSVARVVAAIGMCLKLAVAEASAGNATSETGALGVATDAADAVTGLGAALAADDGSESVTLSGPTAVYARRVITATVNNLRSANWECACGSPHTSDRCSLQRSLIKDLALVNGWVEP